MNFQRLILIIAGILLVISTGVLVYTISKTKTSEIWPSYIANCPDYWEDTTRDGTKCLGTKYNTSSGSNCSGLVDFSGSVCQKYSAMLSCKDVVWDGITYANQSTTNNC